MERKEVDWEAEAKDTKEFLDDGRGKNMPKIFETTTKGSAKALLCLRGLWQQHSAGFRAYWAALPVAQKQGLIRTVSPYMPKDFTHSTINTVMIPEMVLGPLSKSNYCPDLMQKRALFADYWDMFHEDLAFVRNIRAMRGERYLQPVEGIPPNNIKFVVMTNEESYVMHKKYLKTEHGAKLRSMMAMNGVIEAIEYKNAVLRGSMIVTTLVLLLQEYVEEVLQQESPLRPWMTATAEKHGVLTSEGLTNECGLCGADSKPDGTSLLKCGRCKSMLYCSKSCQVAHWPTHKTRCAPSQPKKHER
ncbi:putative Ankyrin repeat and MYND domain-containing protein 1 [Balamuthia mandrillaris]